MQRVLAVFVGFVTVAAAVAYLAQTGAKPQTPAAPPPATTRPAAPPRVLALSIGIGGYTQKPLRYCVSDAQAVARTLREHCDLLLGPQFLMVDGQKDFKDQPTADNIRRATRLLADLATERDILIVFFSGHGVTLDGKGYLVGIDATARERKGLVGIEELRQILRGAKAAWRVLILDACHSGGEKDDDSAAMTAGFKAALQDDSAGFATLASCGENEISREAEWHNQGLFTYWLLLGLRGDADRECAGNQDHEVTLTELYAYVREQVRSEAAMHLHVSQNPILLARLDGDLVLARVTAPATRPAASQPLRDELEARIRERVPLKQLEYAWIPATGRIDLRGPVLTGAELKLLRDRLTDIEPPVGMQDVTVRPAEVLDLVTQELTRRGAQVIEARVRREEDNKESILDIELRVGGEITSATAVRELARQYVLDPTRVRPTIYR